MGYKKAEVLEKLKSIELLENIYACDFVNYLGKTTDTKEKYTEVIAKEILENYNFDKINVIKRDKGYKVESHDGVIKNKMSTRREEIIAKKMFGMEYKDIGKMIDYQVPLKHDGNEKTSEGKRRGKIDLISYNQNNNTLYIIELKNNYSKETLLRCVLEIITYSKLVDSAKLKSDFNIDMNAKVKPAILIFDNTRPWRDLKSNDKYVKALIDKFDVDIFIAKSEEIFSIERANNI